MTKARMTDDGRSRVYLHAPGCPANQGRRVGAPCECEVAELPDQLPDGRLRVPDAVVAWLDDLVESKLGLPAGSAEILQVVDQGTPPRRVLIVDVPAAEVSGDLPVPPELWAPAAEGGEAVDTWLDSDGAPIPGSPLPPPGYDGSHRAWDRVVAGVRRRHGDD